MQAHKQLHTFLNYYEIFNKRKNVLSKIKRLTNSKISALKEGKA